MKLLKDIMSGEFWGETIFYKPENLQARCNTTTNMFYLHDLFKGIAVSTPYPAGFFNLDDVVQDSLKSQFKNLKL